MQLELFFLCWSLYSDVCLIFLTAEIATFLSFKTTIHTMKKPKDK